MKEKDLQDGFDFEQNSMLSTFLKEDENGFTLANFVDYVAERDNSVALCHVDRNNNRRLLTYKDLKELSNQLANYLRAKGVKRGDVVALVLRNNLEFFTAVLAIQKLGAVVFPLQYMNKAEQYNKIFDRANPACIIAEDYEIKQSDGHSTFVLDEINKSVGTGVAKICVGKNSGYSQGWDDLRNCQQESKEFLNEQVNTTDWGYLFATSGTTGVPKLVMHNYGFGLSNYYTGVWYGVQKGQKHFTICDSGWAMASWSMAAVLLHQGILCINDYDRFDPTELLEYIKKEHVYSLCAPRSILKRLIEPLKSNPNLLGDSLKSLSSAGESLSQDDRDEVKKYFGLDLKEGYGMTEAVLPIYETQRGEWTQSPLYSDITLQRSAGFDCDEIIVYGRQLGLLMGYLSNNTDYLEYSEPPIENDLVMWHTSDTGHRNDNGVVCCDGRFGRTVKINDCLVNMGEVESVIKTHPMVFDCVVKSITDGISGNALVAFVELNEGANGVTEDTIRKYVKAKMMDYCRPKHVVFKKLDRTVGGKPINDTKTVVPDKNMTLTRKKPPKNTRYQ